MYESKKPVTLPFVDLSTVTARRRTCEREIELDRRLSSDVYLSLATLVPENGEEGEPAVVMRRLAALELGDPVILDASWADPRHRQAAAAVAHEASALVVELRCVVDVDIAVTRAAHRSADDPSDATPSWPGSWPPPLLLGPVPLTSTHPTHPRRCWMRPWAPSPPAVATRQLKQRRLSSTP